MENNDEASTESLPDKAGGVQGSATGQCVGQGTTATPQIAEQFQISERFLTTIFEPSDRVLIRPIESWLEGDKKCPRTDWKGTKHNFGGGQRPDGSWFWLSGQWAGHISRSHDRSVETRANIYFGVCPRPGGGCQFDKAWQIRTVRVLWADVDDTGSVEEVKQRIKDAGLPAPTIIVHSGNGVHVYWKLLEPYLIDDVDAPPPVEKEWPPEGIEDRRPREYFVDPDTKNRVYLENERHRVISENVPRLSEKATAIQDVFKGIAVKIGGDHTFDLSRLLRVPGTYGSSEKI